MSQIPPDAESLQEQLVAYLDGELDAEASRQIEERLASDPAFRETLRGLDHAWHMLDSLEAAPVDQRFTQTMLQVAVGEAVEEVQRHRHERPRRRLRVVSMLAVSLALAVGIGVLGGGLLRPDDDRQLLENLPVVEHLDDYAQVGDIEFLRQLADAGLFAKEERSETASP